MCSTLTILTQGVLDGGQNDVRTELAALAYPDVTDWRVDNDEIAVYERASSDVQIGPVVNVHRWLDVRRIDDERVSDGRVVFIVAIDRNPPTFCVQLGVACLPRGGRCVSDDILFRWQPVVSNWRCRRNVSEIRARRWSDSTDGGPSLWRRRLGQL